MADGGPAPGFIEQSLGKGAQAGSHPGPGPPSSCPRCLPGQPGPLVPGGPSAAEKAAPLVPLLVADPAHGLQLRLVGVPFIPVAILAPLKHVLAPTVARELVANPPAGCQGWGEDGQPPVSTSCQSLLKPASDHALHLPKFLHGSLVPSG